MKQRKLLSIGALSKQTGVHVKSLRYYDRIGVLPPAYVDPESGYRYYAFSQIQLVEAIQLCVDLDIPLKEFQNFMTDDTHEIRYAKLIAHGTSIANQKMNAIREKLFFLEKMQENIERAERCRGSDTPIRCTMPEKLCFTRPRQGEQTEEELDQAFGHMMGEVV
ncbi:MAG: MerR family transcriptional regulator, partial [Oscillospiraceae bacterium]|nr:MerR family transcriptional regulator [Oscillospiraceae bacterium]